MNPRIRRIEVSDYDRIYPVMDEWWGGRSVRALLPRLFFEHFAGTSFAYADGDELRAFLIGFRSQSTPHVAYIHLVGVAPHCRGKGYGRQLYSHFFDCVRALGCTEVHCITSPVNKGSIAFHRRMGFNIVDTGTELDGVAVARDYAGEGQHRVLFLKILPGSDESVEKHLYELETKLLSAEVRASAALLDSILADGFVEFGASGRVWSKKEMIAALAREATARRTISQFKLSRLDAGLALVTYQITREEPVGDLTRSLRSSLWKFLDNRWQMIFHQGTYAGAAPADKS